MTVTTADEMQALAVQALEMHKKVRGKVKIYPNFNIRNEDDLSLVYVPGTAPVCRAIEKDRNLTYEYTGRGNRMAVVCDGSAVHGMGNIGPYAALPMVEGKCLVLKQYGDINAIPIAVDTHSFEEVIALCRMLVPTMGAINIENISSPNTFSVIRKLDGELDIPILCDDQQGSAVVVLAALQNALTLTGKNIDEIKIVIIGSGASGSATAELLLTAGVQNLVLVNATGILSESNPNMDPVETVLAGKTNPERLRGGLNEALAGADVLIGLSVGNIVTEEHIKKMGSKPVVFAMAMPTPEIERERALTAGAYIYASGNAKEPNSLMNIQAFPGMARGAMDIQAKRFTDNMALAAANALSSVVDKRRLTPEHMFPEFFGNATTPGIAEAVAQAAIADGVAKTHLDPGEVYSHCWNRLYGRVNHI